MAREHIEGLITDLHDRLGGADNSPQQQQMLAQMRAQLADWQGDTPPDGDLRETAELLLEEVGENHPTAAKVLRDIIQTLHNAGF